ncbi:hypothetical protein [Kineosporia babensis]|uniref:Uncharacterized protein n=1 Tax=Kineosporia babensis TaxID=499548 RepID=A0A9X1NFS3_9ACTN|nr:hypothetical protein [Kineosporia babensis]MCD5313080.1 hypothetical protein [Kineosporia babensis]
MANLKPDGKPFQEQFWAINETSAPFSPARLVLTDVRRASAELHRRAVQKPCNVVSFDRTLALINVIKEMSTWLSAEFSEVWQRFRRCVTRAV